MTEIMNGESDVHADQFLTFLIDADEYGLPILDVQEIKSWGPVTRLPRTPPQVLGVMNLRGAIVPLIDLRRCFGLSDVPRDASTAVIVVNAATSDAVDGRRQFGLVVDRVSEVYRLRVEPVPAGADVTRDGCAAFVSGFGHVDDQLVILLDPSAIIESGLASPNDDAMPGAVEPRSDAA